MGIGAGIFLFAVGAILAFALETEVGGIDLDVVGWILMIVGIVGVVLTLTIWGPRRRAVVTEEAPVAYRRDPATYRRVEERSDVPPTDPL
jgi:Domain of unknown function (DUF6458)